MISPQSLLIRFVASFTIVLLASDFVSLEKYFVLSLGQTLIFSLFMMLFYSIMVKCLLGKENIPLYLALSYRYGYLFVSFICFNLFFQQPFSWLIVELIVFIFGQRGSKHD